jgi:hypothetical protein
MPSLGTYVKNEFRLWQGNIPLVEDCRARSAGREEDPSRVIVRALWKALQASERVLRVVK